MIIITLMTAISAESFNPIKLKTLNLQRRQRTIYTDSISNDFESNNFNFSFIPGSTLESSWIGLDGNRANHYLYWNATDLIANNASVLQTSVTNLSTDKSRRYCLKFTMIPLTPDTQLNVRLRWLRDNGRLFTVYSVLDIYTRDYCDRFNITRKPMTRCVAMFDYRSRRKRVWSIIERLQLRTVTNKLQLEYRTFRNSVLAIDDIVLNDCTPKIVAPTTTEAPEHSGHSYTTTEFVEPETTPVLTTEAFRETTTSGNPVTFEVLYKNKMSSTPLPMARNMDNLFDEIDEGGSTEDVELETEPVTLPQRFERLEYREAPSNILTCTAHLTLIWAVLLY